MTRWLSLLFLFSLGFCHQYFSPFDFLKYEQATINADPSVVVSVSPNKLNQSGDWVTVQWEGVLDPSSDDWIGVYAPPNGESVDPSKIAPVKFQYCKESPTYLSSGKGSFNIRLVNVRTPYIFAFLKGGFNSPTLVSTSSPVTFSSFNEPLQAHLAFTNDPTALTLMWNTKDTHQPKVKLWEDKKDYVRIEPAESTGYSNKDMCGSPATTVGYIDPGVFHSVRLTGLVPGSEYHYQFGDDASVNGQLEWSPVFTFRMPPAPSPNASLSFIAFGDMGQAQVDDTQQPIAAQPPAINNTLLIEKELSERDFVLHIGDISYARGYAGVWDEFFDLIQPISSAVPYMVCGGNHERDYPKSGSYYEGTDSGGECGVPYEIRFQMPRPKPKQHWYSYSVGSLHVVLMSTELDFTVDSEQYNWLKDHLSSVNRSLTPWLLFAGHRPMYIDSDFGMQAASDLVVAKELQDNVEPLLMQYKVDLAFWGHHHSYQRTCPVYKRECQQDGTAPVHVVIGMGGQSLSKNLQDKQPDWIQYLDVNDYGYTRINVTPLSLTLQYITIDGSMKDTFTLHKQ